MEASEEVDVFGQVPSEIFYEEIMPRVAADPRFARNEQLAHIADPVWVEQRTRSVETWLFESKTSKKISLLMQQARVQLQKPTLVDVMEYFLAKNSVRDFLLLHVPAAAITDRIVATLMSDARFYSEEIDEWVDTALKKALPTMPYYRALCDTYRQQMRKLAFGVGRAQNRLMRTLLFAIARQVNSEDAIKHNDDNERKAGRVMYFYALGCASAPSIDPDAAPFLGLDRDEDRALVAFLILHDMARPLQALVEERRRNFDFHMLDESPAFVGRACATVLIAWVLDHPGTNYLTSHLFTLVNDETVDLFDGAYLWSGAGYAMHHIIAIIGFMARLPMTDKTARFLSNYLQRLRADMEPDDIHVRMFGHAYDPSPYIINWALCSGRRDLLASVFKMATSLAQDVASVSQDRALSERTPGFAERLTGHKTRIDKQTLQCLIAVQDELERQGLDSWLHEYPFELALSAADWTDILALDSLPVVLRFVKFHDLLGCLDRDDRSLDAVALALARSQIDALGKNGNYRDKPENEAPALLAYRLFERGGIPLMRRFIDTFTEPALDRAEFVLGVLTRHIRAPVFAREADFVVACIAWVLPPAPYGPEGMERRVEVVMWRSIRLLRTEMGTFASARLVAIAIYAKFPAWAKYTTSQLLSASAPSTR
jgi:hypothetical protein